MASTRNAVTADKHTEIRKSCHPALRLPRSKVTTQARVTFYSQHPRPAALTREGPDSGALPLPPRLLFRSGSELLSRKAHLFSLIWSN